MNSYYPTYRKATVANGVPTVSDADAQAFLNAAVITDLTQANAVNELVIGLKADSLWTKFVAIYPFVGGTANTHKWNLKDPRDLNAAFRLVFGGTVTHNSSGMKGNNSNGYADTFVVPATHLSQNNLSYLLWQTVAGASFTYEGVKNTSGYIMIRNVDGSYDRTLNDSGWANEASASPNWARTTIPTTGLTGVSRSSSTTADRIVDNTFESVSRTSVTPSSNSFYIGAVGGWGLSFSSHTTGAALIGQGLNSTEAGKLYARLSIFQVALGRAPYDSDAQAFITASGITDTTQKNAIHALVVGLKADGLWNKFYAIYPMVGGTAATHKWNLKDPRDLDAAYRLTFAGTVTHNSNGVTGNGTSGYANTSLNDSTVGVSTTNYCFGAYSRTNSTGSRVAMGSVTAFNYSWLAPRWSSTEDYAGPYIEAIPANVLTSSTGFFTANRSSSTNTSLYRNGSLVNTYTAANTGLQNLNMFLMCRNLFGSGSNYSSDNYAFFFMATAMTSSEQTSLYNRIQTYQTSLGRNV